MIRVVFNFDIKHMSPYPIRKTANSGGIFMSNCQIYKYSTMCLLFSVET